jgi:hypothetical protein
VGPLGFLTGVVLGSAASIAAVLVMVGVIFLVVSSDHPALLEEYLPLVRAAGFFAVLAAVSGAAFYGLQKRTAWRWVAQGAMWAVLAAIAWAYWPEPVA